MVIVSHRAYLGLDSEVTHGVPRCALDILNRARLSSSNHSPPAHFLCIWATSFCRCLGLGPEDKRPGNTILINWPQFPQSSVKQLLNSVQMESYPFQFLT